MRPLACLAMLVLALAAATEARAAAPRLKRFSSCAQLLTYARHEARRTGGGVGVLPRALPPGVETISAPQRSEGAVPVAAPAPATPDFSGTNVQEAGVDEPDVVKTDGQRIYAVTDGTLRIVDVTGAAPRLVGSLKLDGAGQRLLVHGDRVLAIAAGGFAGPILPVRGAPVPAVGIAEPGIARADTIVTEIDVSDPAHPSVRRTMTVPGTFVDARQNGGTARLVIDSSPAAIPLAAISHARLGRFLGHTVLRSRLTGRTYRRALAPCDQIRRPPRFSGLDVLAILTVDLDRGMYSLDRDGVMAGAQLVYGSPDSLYVASRDFSRPLELGTTVPDGVRTEIHRFDISGPDRTSYVASGSVPGFLVNSYALSEFDGDLRVASTEEPPWLDGDVSSSASRLTVLRQDGATLQPIGSVGGLGHGQRIYAVRYEGDKAFVVTFRQVDPLYALDLSDPRAPAVRGALELPGYSAYLHPVSDSLLLGIGRTGESLDASLFDVSDLAAPRLLSRLDLGNGASAAEFDPHAFLYWPPAKLAVLPVSLFDPHASPFDGALAVRVGDPLAVAGRITHDTGDSQIASIQRSLVIGDDLFTVSYRGLQENRLDTLATVGFTAF
jgi:uncharacterized secreted protein with C-terminal beta-propeller domain